MQDSHEGSFFTWLTGCWSWPSAGNSVAIIQNTHSWAQFQGTITPQYPHGIGSRTHTDTKFCWYTYKTGQYSHITYGHPPSHFKPSLDYPGHLTQCESEVSQLCPTLCNPMDCSLPGSSTHGIFQARVLEWGATSFSRRSSQHRDWTWVSPIADRRFTVWATKEACKYNVNCCRCVANLGLLWGFSGIFFLVFLLHSWLNPRVQSCGYGRSTVCLLFLPLEWWWSMFFKYTPYGFNVLPSTSDSLREPAVK